jgi:hypothetical protein
VPGVPGVRCVGVLRRVQRLAVHRQHAQLQSLT